MKDWLCLGSKKLKKCLFAETKITEEYHGIGMNYFPQRVKVLNVYCMKKHRYVHKFITTCDDFQNSVLEIPIEEQNINKGSSIHNSKVGEKEK